MPEGSVGSDLIEMLIKHLDARERLQAHILVTGEACRVKNDIAEETLSVTGDTAFTTIRRRLREYDEAVIPLLRLVTTGCFGGSADMAQTWINTIEFMAEFQQPPGQSLVNLLRLRAYPALLLAYGAGVSAIAGGNYDLLAALLTHVRTVNPRTDEAQALPQNLYPAEIIDSQYESGIFENDQQPRDLSSHLRRIIRPTVSGLVPSERKFDEGFDRFEAFLAIVHADIHRRNGRSTWQWIPQGRFLRRQDNQPSIWETLKAEADAQGEEWAPIRAGLFQGSATNFSELIEGIDQFLAGSRNW